MTSADSQDAMTVASAPPAEKPRKQKRGWRSWTAIGIGAFLVMVYLFSLLAYAEAGLSQVETGPDPIPATSSGVNFGFDLIAMDPAKSQMTLRMLVSPQGDYLDPTDGSFAKSLRLTVRYQTSGEVIR
ncbi:MAG: hypothetical protein WC054_11225, partial [Candidatus Nanopelagicales bacterium]